MNVFSNIGFFLVDTLFTLFIALFMLRLLLGIFRADFYNPLSQFIVSATSPILRPLRKILRPIGRVDTAAIFIMLLLTIIQYTLLLSLREQNIDLVMLIPFAVIKLIEMLIYIFIIALIIQAVISWVNPGAHSMQNPMMGLLNSLTRPLLTPLSRIVPKVGMLDLSPLVAILGLNVLLIIISSLV